VNRETKISQKQVNPTLTPGPRERLIQPRRESEKWNAKRSRRSTLSKKREETDQLQMETRREGVLERKEVFEEKKTSNVTALRGRKVFP